MAKRTAEQQQQQFEKKYPNGTLGRRAKANSKALQNKKKVYTGQYKRGMDGKVRQQTSREADKMSYYMHK
jgi:hypothetical protein